MVLGLGSAGSTRVAPLGLLWWVSLGERGISDWDGCLPLGHAPALVSAPYRASIIRQWSANWPVPLLGLETGHVVQAIGRGS
jgi:hypothetical protein